MMYYIFVLAAVFLMGSAFAQQCEHTGERNYEGEECICERSCVNWQDEEFECPTECTQGCGCEEGLLRSESGDCVTIPECPLNECPEGERNFGKDCLPCQLTCNNWYRDNVPCTRDCRMYSCGCIEGYVRDENDVCIPTSDCPAQECSEGEINFGVDCLPCQKTCNNWFRDDVICTRECATNKCGCIEDYVRDENDVCVPTSECKCKFGEIFYGSDCLPCQLTCENWYRDDVACTLQCITESCGCAEGYVKDENDACVSISTCPDPVCNPGETFYTDGHCKPCEQTCENYQEVIACNLMCVLNRCGCSEGNVRNTEGVCVPTSECPVIQQ